MKKLMLIFILVISSFAGYSQDVEISDCHFYMDDNNQFSNMFVVTNLRPDDTLEYIKFRFFLFSSQSNPKTKYFHVVPLYNTMNLEHVPGNSAWFGAFANAEYGKTITVDNISWRHNAWFTKMDDVIGARITEVEVRYKSGYVVILDGFPKNSRVRKGEEHPPFYL